MKGTQEVATINRRTSRKSLAIALGIVGVAGLSMASAAQLTVDSTDVSAGMDTIVDCNTAGDVTVSYSPEYDSTVPGYVVDEVDIGNLGGSCTGTILVTVTDGVNAALASGSIAYADGTVTVTLIPTAPATTIEVADIEGVAVAIG